MMTPRVLLIDDEIPFLMNTRETLSLVGYRVSSAINGEQGLCEINKDSYDVVVLDLRMPGISGLDVLKKIETRKDGAPEVIIITGHSTQESMMEGLANGAFDYLSKPIKFNELVQRIDAAYQRKMRKAH